MSCTSPFVSDGAYHLQNPSFQALLRLTWVFVMKGDLCAYMLQESKAREDAARREKQVAFALPAKTSALGHSAPIVGVHPCHDGTAITVGEDGIICCWSSELKPQKTKDVFVGF